MSLNGSTSTYSGNETYGALIIPYVPKKFAPLNDVKEQQNFKGKLTSALQNAGNSIKNAITNPGQTITNACKYLKDNRPEIMDKLGVIGSKFSGIAIAQALADGKISSKEALDYLCLGFAPALNQTGVALGYSGLQQIKDALSNGSINVGAFFNGLTKAQKGITDLKDTLMGKQTSTEGYVIEFDLTSSHDETYQAETPDRRVESGNTLSETVHNMPIIFNVQCAFQDEKRYSKSEFRAIFTELRDRKTLVQLVLGDEIFEDLILTKFEPNHDCTKSGFDYTLSFKQITIGSVDLTQEITIQPIPITMESSSISSSGIGGTNVKGLGNVKIPAMNVRNDINQAVSSVTSGFNWKTSIAKQIVDQAKGKK